MAKSTFQGVIRTYGGQDKSSGVTPAPVMCAEVINFLASTTTATTVKIGTSASGLPFVLPIGAIPIDLTIITASSTATTTVDIGTASNSTAFGDEIVTGVANTTRVFNGTGVTGVGVTANVTVFANVGATAGTGTVVGVFRYAIVDNGQPSE